MKTPTTTFSHGGKFGDLIYALPLVKHCGGGDIVLHPFDGSGLRFTPESVEAIRPLLESQAYVRDVRYADSPRGLNLDVYRQRWKNHLNISDIIFEWQGLPYWPRQEPWLEVDPDPVSRVVFARCPRYRNNDFPWGRVVQQYGTEAVFVGHPDEHAEFCNRFGRVRYYPTADFLALARVIAGAQLFVGNQSAPRAVAEGLKVPVIQETDRSNDNCHWGRPDAWYGYDQTAHLPPLADMPPCELRVVNGLASEACRTRRTLISTDRMLNLARLAFSVRHLDGDAAELGVYRGGSARAIRAATGKVVRLFDTFAGIPTDDEIAGGHKAGEFAAGLADVRDCLGDEGYEYHPGEFPGTAPADDRRYSFVHLDPDIYQAVKAGLAYFLPRMVAGGVIVLDDYGWVNCPGVVRAVTEAGIGVNVALGQAWYVAGDPAPPIVIEQGANGIGDALLGLTVVSRLAEDNPAVPVHYRVSEKALPWVELFAGYDALGTTGRTHTEDAGQGILQMNAGFYADLHAGCPTPRRERYAKNVGASGSQLPTLRDPSDVRSAGESTTGYVVLAPFSEDASRQWPLAEWLTLESLLSRAGFSTVVLHDRATTETAGVRPINFDPGRIAEEGTGDDLYGSGFGVERFRDGARRRSAGDADSRRRPCADVGRRVWWLPVSKMPGRGAAIACRRRGLTDAQRPLMTGWEWRKSFPGDRSPVHTN